MNKRSFLVLTTSLVISALAASPLANADESNTFPLRKIYPEIRVIDTANLTGKLDDLTVIDVRPSFEYELTHIKGAINLPIEDSKFVESAKKANAETGKALVFYCGSESCAKSYQAAMKARNVIGLDRTWAYDSGVEVWAKTNPQLTISLNKPLDPKTLIGEDKFKAHLLSPKDFISKATADINAKVVDLRDRSQTEGVSVFPVREIRTNLDIVSLRKIIAEAKQANQAIYFYDYAGNKIKSLQYLLEDMGMKEYYFMKGGMGGYYEMLNGK
jgi:rhodanese-related sulfurtransferase